MHKINLLDDSDGWQFSFLVHGTTHYQFHSSVVAAVSTVLVLTFQHIEPAFTSIYIPYLGFLITWMLTWITINQSSNRQVYFLFSKSHQPTGV